MLHEPVDLTARAAAAVAERKRPLRMPELGTFQQAKLAAVERASRPRDTTRTCMTGMHRIDHITGGLRPKFCWLVGGDTNIGKSTFGVALAGHNLLRGLGTLIVSSEDPIDLYGARFLQWELGLSAIKMRDGRLSKEDLHLARENAEQSAPWPCYISADGVPLETVCEWVDWAIEEYSIKLTIWDYLQEFYLDRPAENDRLTTKRKAKLMRTVARRTGTAEVTLSQLTVDQHTGIPTRHHIRDCRDAGHGADVIGLLYRTAEELDNDQTVREPEKRHIHLDKVKDGPSGMSVQLDWRPVSASFQPMPAPEKRTDLDDEWDDYFDGKSAAAGGEQ